nr:unnamed protein product [Callosobruchus analis]
MLSISFLVHLAQ